MNATATRPAKSTRPARKAVARTIRLLRPGRVSITVGKVEKEYEVREFPVGGAFDGRAFKVETFGSESYNVFLSRSGQDDTCDCAGFTYHSHCKHQAGLKALLSRGKLDSTPALNG